MGAKLWKERAEIRVEGIVVTLKNENRVGHWCWSAETRGNAAKGGGNTAEVAVRTQPIACSHLFESGVSLGRNIVAQALERSVNLRGEVWQRRGGKCRPLTSEKVVVKYIHEYACETSERWADAIDTLTNYRMRICKGVNAPMLLYTAAEFGRECCEC